LSHIIFSQTCTKLQNDSIEHSEVDNYLKKKDFTGIMKGASKSQICLIPANLELHEITSHKQGLAAKSEVASFETNFFRIACTSEAETSMSAKAECLLRVGEDKKGSSLE